MITVKSRQFALSKRYNANEVWLSINSGRCLEYLIGRATFIQMKKKKKKSVNQPTIHPSIHPSIPHPSIHRTINPSINQSIKQAR
jgi:hypothetical protein